MTVTFPSWAEPVVRDFADLLGKHFGDSLYGVYLYGSLASGLGDEFSDIDFVAVLREAPTPEQTITLDHIHRELAARHGAAHRLDGVYLGRAQLGKTNSDLGPYPYSAEGKFHPSGYYDLNAVTWWSLRMAVCGPPLPPLIKWQQVKDYMMHNLQTYWVNQLAAYRSNPDMSLDDESVEWTVLMLCRIYHTLTVGNYTSKRLAGEHALTVLPERWHLQVREALRIRTIAGSRSLYPSAEARADGVLAFADWLIEECTRRGTM